jgi:hypothetical protein
MDFIVQLPKTKQGYDSIVVFVDKFTKRAHFVPTYTTATAPDIAKIFFNEIFRLHGLPKTIISDRDVKFTSQFWKSLFTQLGTKLAMSTAFHPQTDGQTERLNRTLEEMLRIFITYKQDNWDECLAAAEFAYNNSKQASTQHTPFELDCGQSPYTPITINTDNKVAASQEFLEHWNTMIKTAKDALMEAQNKQQKYANQHRKFEEFEIGQKVLLSTRFINTLIDKQRPTRKLNAKYIGPFNIVNKISPVAYKLELPNNMKMHPVFHISLLKLYNEDDEFNRPTPPPAIITSDNEEEYEVENILDKRIVRKQSQYLIKWAGYPLYDSTWEPLDNLKNAMKKVQAFEKAHS